MTAPRIPEEPFSLDDTCTYWRVQGVKYTKYSVVSYGLMEIQDPEGGARLARVGPNYYAWFMRGSHGPAPDDIDFEVSEKEREAAARWYNAASGPNPGRSRPPATSPAVEGAGKGNPKRTWGYYTWKKTEIKCPHCSWQGKPSIKLVEFDAMFRRNSPAAFHCPNCFKDIGFVDFFDSEDDKANWDDLSEESRATVLQNEATRNLGLATRLVDAAQLPDLEGEELRFTWHWTRQDDGWFMVLALGERVVWRQSLGAESEGVNFYSRVASILKERYGDRARDLVPTPEAIARLAESDTWVYQDMYGVGPGQIKSTANAVDALRRKLFGVDTESVEGISPGLEALIAGMKPKPKAVPRPAWSSAGPWVTEKPAQGSFPKKGKRGRKRDRDRWRALQAVREDEALQAKHPVAEGKAQFGEFPDPCPSCGRPGDQLSWFYFESPPWTWTNLCGRAGWILVCDTCQRRIASLCTLIC